MALRAARRIVAFEARVRAPMPDGFNVARAIPGKSCLVGLDREGGSSRDHLARDRLLRFDDMSAVAHFRQLPCATGHLEGLDVSGFEGAPELLYNFAPSAQWA